MKTNTFFRGVFFFAAAFFSSVLAMQAQTAPAGSFPCLPKAERDKAEKLLAACRVSYDAAARKLTAELDPLFDQADAIRSSIDRERYRRLAAQGDAKAAEPSGNVEAEAAAAIAKAESAFLSRYEAKTFMIGAPAEAVALAKLLRAKALKTDLNAIEKTERALEAVLPRRNAEGLKALGARFKAGGAAAYLAYVSCLCESWLIDPDPFARLASGEAKSLNDSASVRKTLTGMRDALSLQKSFLSHPGYLAYPPAVFLPAGRADEKGAAACFAIFLSMGGDALGDREQAALYLDQRISSRLLDFGNFFPLLPDSAFRRLVLRFGKPEAYPLKLNRSLAAESEGGEVEAALALIAEFESSLESGTEEKKAERALALIQDAKACAILNSLPGYAGQREKLLAYWEGRVAGLAAAAFPGKEARLFSSLDTGSLSLVLVLKESVVGWSLPLGELEIVKKLKPDSITKPDRLALARLADSGRVISLSPLKLVRQEEAAAFSWRFRLFGGLR